MTRPVSPGSPGHTGACEAFAQAAVLRVDRELGPAEAELLDTHLATCGACRKKAAEAEAISSLLRNWDAETAERARAPARLRLAIRTAAAQHGRWRRDEIRLFRRARLAAAASVLLVIGAGVLAGLLVSPTSSPARARPAVDVAEVPRPVRPTARVPVTPLPPPSAVLSSLADLDVEPMPIDRLSDEERRVATATLTRLEGRHLRRTAFERLWNEPAVWYVNPATGEERLVTWRSYRFRGPDAPPVAAVSRPVESPTVVDENPPQDTGRRVADFLQLPGRRDRIENLLTGLRLPLLAGPADGRVKVAEVLVLSGPEERGPRRGQVIDLVRAVRDGALVLREGQDDDLVALARDLRWPVFVPAGELIAGGRVDRVVLEGVWIPATVGESRVVIRCAAASTPGAVKTPVPTPTGMMGGPALRRQIAQGADADRVRAWIGDRVPIVDGWGRDYTLLSFYSPAGHEQNLRSLAEPLLRIRARGFVATDPAGNLETIEVSDLPAESAVPLLVRLIEGYLAEASMDHLRSRLHGEPAPDTARTGGRAASLALLDLVGSGETFRSRAWDGRSARVLRMVEPATQAAVEVMERFPGGQSVLTTVYWPAKR